MEAPYRHVNSCLCRTSVVIRTRLRVISIGALTVPREPSNSTSSSWFCNSMFGARLLACRPSTPSASRPSHTSARQPAQPITNSSKAAPRPCQPNTSRPSTTPPPTPGPPATRS
ncbi:hypothetical protein VTK26DRAFT_8985 [Humicola hyalothermophila]